MHLVHMEHVLLVPDQVTMISMKKMSLILLTQLQDEANPLVGRDYHEMLVCIMGHVKCFFLFFRERLSLRQCFCK